MLQNFKRLKGFSLEATDGEIGKVTDFLFDDKSWTVRYMVVKTGGWLMGREVLISPQSIKDTDNDKESFPVNLTKDQIKDSPDVDTQKTVSRQHEIELHNYYPWQSYWGAPAYGGMMGIGTTIPISEAIEQREREKESHPDHESVNDSHLRSCNAVKGYDIDASDGDIGEVEDFILDDRTWKIVFMIVDTGNWFPGKNVLVSPQWIKDFHWDRSAVEVNLSRDQIRNSPEYDPSQPVSESYAASLYSHYGQYPI